MSTYYPLTVPSPKMSNATETVIDFSIFENVNPAKNDDNTNQTCKLKSECPAIQRLIGSLIYY